MHLDFLIEDVSGKIMLEILLPKVLPAGVSYTTALYNFYATSEVDEASLHKA